MSDEHSTPGGFPLTDEQKDALKLGSNLALTAGAGTGKTTTLTERYKTILDTDPAVEPENCLTLTFTKDAAGEMREKIRDAIDDELAAADGEDFDRWRAAKDDLEDAYIHTIHAFCSRILREFSVEAGIHPDFETLDEGDADDVIEQAITTVLDRYGATDGLDDRAGRLGPASRGIEDTLQDDSDWDPHAELKTLTQLYSRSNLASALASLFDERPDSIEWADRWADKTADEYQAHCETFVESSIDPSAADNLIETDRAQEAIARILDLADQDLDVPATDNGIELLEELSTFLAETDAHGENGSATDRQRFLLKVANGVTTGSGSLYSGSRYYAGAKTNWDENGHKDERIAFKNALDALAELIEPEERNLDHDPIVERNGARQAISLARIFQITRDEYQRYKQRRNALDYSDLITEVISFLEEHERARRTLRDQFKYIMVDEVQDTDPRQWDVVKLLSGEDPDRFDGQNVFLVGDEKQSIYRFRDADVTQFRAAREMLVGDNPPGFDGDLELTGNFRTVNPTLTTINEMFEAVLQPAALTDESDEDDDGSSNGDGPEHEPYEAEPQWLTAKRDDGTAIEGSVEYLLVPDDEAMDEALGFADSWYTDSEFISKAEREAKAIAARLTDLFAADTDVWDPEVEEYTTAQPRHVALLFRSSRRLTAFEREFEAHDIPYTNLAGSGFFDTPEIRPLVNLFKVFEDPHATIPLYGVLRSPLFGFTDETLTTAYAPDTRLWDGLECATPELQDARDKIAEWRTQAGLGDQDRIQQWSTLVSTIIDETGYLIAIGADERPQQAVANVEKFRQQLRNWEEGSAQSITAIIDRIERTREGEEDPSEATIPSDIEGVQLRTIHSAKGLEFPIVVVPEITRQFNMRSSIPKGHFERIDGEPILGLKAPNANDVYSHSNTATYQHVREHYRRRERAEQRRLLYVATTRTRDHLILSGTHSIDEDTDTGLPEPGDWADARSWQDWIQPTLLEETNLITKLGNQPTIGTMLGDGPYTVRRPTPPAEWAPASTDDAVPSDIEIPAPERSQPKRRLSASQFRDRLSEVDTPELLKEPRDADTDIDQTNGAPALDSFDSTTIGSIVHKLCELEPEKSEWPSIIRRLIEEPDELSDAGVEEIIRQTERGLDVVDVLESGSAIHSRHSELSVTLDLDVATVVGDIDQLSVTDEGYIITDFKTSTVDEDSITKLTEHYYLQLLAYAGALVQSDPQAGHVQIAVAYTDAGVIRSRTLAREDISSLCDWANQRLERMFT